MISKDDQTVSEARSNTTADLKTKKHKRIFLSNTSSEHKQKLFPEIIYFYVRRRTSYIFSWYDFDFISVTNVKVNVSIIVSDSHRLRVVFHMREKVRERDWKNVDSYMWQIFYAIKLSQIDSEPLCLLVDSSMNFRWICKHAECLRLRRRSLFFLPP